VVAGRDRHEAAGSFRLGKREDLVQSAPGLEGAGLLKALALQKKAGSRAVTELARRKKRRPVDFPGDPPPRGGM
jgi:hypothetical protein